jgi:hypothetical protein
VTDLDEKIYELWKELKPREAYLQGLDEYAGRFFIPSKENVKRVLGIINDLKSKSEDQVRMKFLTSLEASLRYREPPHDLSDMIWTLFGYLMKEGTNSPNFPSLIEHMDESLDNLSEIHKLGELPIELKIIVTNNGNGLLGLLKTISDGTNSEELKKSIEDISEKIRSYIGQASVEGLEKGDFSETYPILKNLSKGDLGRRNTYPQLMMEQYDYYETPDEIEKKGLLWLDSELPDLISTASELAAIYGIGDTIEEVNSEIAKRRNIDKTDLVDFILDFRIKTRSVVEKHLVKINPKYDTRIIETPEYLINFIPTAAMMLFDTLTDHPFNVMFVTTDEKGSPPTNALDLFQLIVHEEYGHCVNFSNSAIGFASEPDLIEKLDSSLHFPISEAISFHREIETQTLIEELAKKDRERLSKEEIELLDAMASWGNLNEVILESRFLILKWRVIRFIRAIGDVRINMNKQSVVEFVEWASKKTGFSEKAIYNQIFFFQENPGIAPCYSIAGMALKDIQDEARRKGKDILEFNTKASSLGFPARSIFEERLRNL